MSSVHHGPDPGNQQMLRPAALKLMMTIVWHAGAQAPMAKTPLAAGAALGYLQDNAAFVPCSTSAPPGATAGAWAEARAEQSRQAEAIRCAQRWRTLSATSSVLF